MNSNQYAESPKVKKEKYHIPYAAWAELILALVSGATYYYTRDIMAFVVAIFTAYFFFLTITVDKSTFDLSWSARELGNDIKGSFSQLHREIRDTVAGVRQELVLQHVADLDLLGKGRFDVTENEATGLMTNLAERAQFEIVATSYYDVEHWLGPSKFSTFWSDYTMQLRFFLMEQTAKRARTIPDEKLLEESLKENPPMSRVFVLDIDIEEQGWEKRARRLIDIIDAHCKSLGEGYEVRCATRKEVQGISLVENSGEREARLHDFVMFDRSIVVEIVRSPSQWIEHNIHGIVYAKGTSLSSPDWIERFKKYFENMYAIARPYADFRDELQKRMSP